MQHAAFLLFGRTSLTIETGACMGVQGYGESMRAAILDVFGSFSQDERGAPRALVLQRAFALPLNKIVRVNVNMS